MCSRNILRSLFFVLLFIMLFEFLGCSKVHYNEFTLSKHLNKGSSIQFATFDLIVYANSCAHTQCPNSCRLDSMYELLLFVRSKDSVISNKMSFAYSFIMDSISIKYSDSIDVYPELIIYKDTVIRRHKDTRFIQFNEIPVPDRINELDIHIRVSYLNDSSQRIPVVIDTTMYRVKGHYKVPLGFLLD